MARKAPSIARALQGALRASQHSGGDAAAVALATRYALLLDRAEELAAEAADIRPETDDQAKRLAALAAKVDALTVASDLGPKLLAALAALKLTPAARSAIVEGREVTRERPNPVARLRAVADERAARRAN